MTGGAAIGDERVAALLALDNAHATELSFLDAARLRAMLGWSFHAREVGDAEAFILAFDQGAPYDSPNFLWFRERFARFVYIDRVVVAQSSRGRGCARRLYQDLIAAAVAAGHGMIGCEVNSDPPNPASDAFHAALGFEQAGAATVAGGAKTVRYLMLRIGA